MVKPVALPPGRARLSTKPAPTGSTTLVNTIGTVRVACSMPRWPCWHARMTSGASATNSAAYLRCRRHCRRPSECRSARCGRRSSPIVAAPARKPLTRARPSGSSAAKATARRCVACARLLRPRRNRPRRRRAAEQRDELAAVHCLVPPVLKIERIAHLGTAGDCRVAAFQSSLCRSWVKLSSALPQQRQLGGHPRSAASCHKATFGYASANVSPSVLPQCAANYGLRPASCLDDCCNPLGDVCPNDCRQLR